MANIMINKICNLKCPYCFANEFVNNISDIKNGNGNMTLESFKEAVNFCLKTTSVIRIIGGEPLLHPEFETFMNLLIEDKRVSDIHIFTNGLEIDKHMNIFINPKITCLVNLNSPNDMGMEKFNKTISNINKLVADNYCKHKVTLGINMYKLDFDYDYMLEVIDKYKFDNVRTSIAIPNDKNINALDYFHEIKPRVFEFFSKLQQINVLPMYDCNIMPGCITTIEEKIWLNTFSELSRRIRKDSSLLESSCCGGPIDILPDLTAVRCFGLSEHEKVYIENFRNIEEIQQYFKMYYDDFAFNVLTDERCKNCEERLKRKCMGGCIAFKIDKINKVREFIKEM